MNSAGSGDQKEGKDGKDNGIEAGRQTVSTAGDKFTGEVKKNDQANGLEVVGR